MIKNENILLGHGSGGQLSHELIRDLFVRNFTNDILKEQTDAAILKTDTGQIAFTTDSFVVDPIFFPGGNIGKLAVCGTVNDLAVSGAEPLYLSASFIIEEGFPIASLEEIVGSMGREANKAGIMIVTGDTKVVNRGKCDKIFINTSGIGRIDPAHSEIAKGSRIRPGDKIIINGSIGDHGMAVLAARNDLNLASDIQSDCACLNDLIGQILKVSEGVRFMRDPTRGGLATVLAEVAEGREFDIRINESALVVNEKVRGICELLGFDPLYVANEGKVLLIVADEDAQKVLEIMHKHEFGKEASLIGEIGNTYPGKAWMETGIGGKRILDMLAGEQLPRIC